MAGSTSGFMPAFRRLLDEHDVQRRLLSLTDGERRMTNLLHLGELLQTALSEAQRGPLALVEWLGLMRNDTTARADLGAEAAQIRLESDDRAVQLVTIHKSKGLEYPIVFCPYLWDGTLLHDEDAKLVRFHDPDDDDRLTLDIGSAAHAAHVERATRGGLGREPATPLRGADAGQASLQRRVGTVQRSRDVGARLPAASAVHAGAGCRSGARHCRADRRARRTTACAPISTGSSRVERHDRGCRSRL